MYWNSNFPESRVRGLEGLGPKPIRPVPPLPPPRPQPRAWGSPALSLTGAVGGWAPIRSLSYPQAGEAPAACILPGGLPKLSTSTLGSLLAPGGPSLLSKKGGWLPFPLLTLPLRGPSDLWRPGGSQVHRIPWTPHGIFWARGARGSPDASRGWGGPHVPISCPPSNPNTPDTVCPRGSARRQGVCGPATRGACIPDACSPAGRGSPPGGTERPAAPSPCGAG